MNWAPADWVQPICCFPYWKNSSIGQSFLAEHGLPYLIKMEQHSKNCSKTKSNWFLRKYVLLYIRYGKMFLHKQRIFSRNSISLKNLLSIS